MLKSLLDSVLRLYFSILLWFSLKILPNLRTIYFIARPLSLYSESPRLKDGVKMGMGGSGSFGKSNLNSEESGGEGLVYSDGFCAISSL